MKLFHTYTNEWGVTRQFFSDDEGNITVNAIQDLEPLVDHNVAQANHRGKEIVSDYANHVATVPPVWMLHWLKEEGWWFYDAFKDPDVEKKLVQKLNDLDFRKLKTSELRL